jgi:hypothetical protein
MNRTNVVPISERELAQLNARSDALLELDADAWDAACDVEAMGHPVLCCSHWRTPAPGDADG